MVHFSPFSTFLSILSPRDALFIINNDSEGDALVHRRVRESVVKQVQIHSLVMYARVLRLRLSRRHRVFGTYSFFNL